MYKAERPGRPLRVYHLCYSDSLEKQKYVAAIRKEQDAFASLIDAKQHLVIPVDNAAPQALPQLAGAFEMVVASSMIERMTDSVDVLFASVASAGCCRVQHQTQPWSAKPTDVQSVSVTLKTPLRPT